MIEYNQGIFFSKSGYFFSILKKGQGSPPPCLSLVTHLIGYMTLQCKTSQNGQTHLQIVAANAAGFLSVFNQFGALCVKVIRLIPRL